MDALYDFGEQTIMNDLQIATDRFYIDIEFLKYLKMGKILSHPYLTREQYDQIMMILGSEQFKQRATDNPETLLKNIPQIEQLFQVDHGQNDDVLFVISPAFDLAVDMINHCLDINNTARRLKSEEKPTIVVIDIGPIAELSPTFRERIIQEYQEFFQTRVELTDKLNVDVDYGVYFVGDLQRFNATMISKLDAQQCMNKFICCSKVLPLHLLPKVSEHNLEQTFYNIELTMSAAARFQFIPPLLCLA